MLLIGASAWLLGMVALTGSPGLRGSRVVFGLGIGAFVAALLIAAPATGAAAASALPGPFDGSAFASYMTSQLVWLAAVLLGAVGYGLSRLARKLPSASLFPGTEVVAIALTSALLLASTYAMTWLVPLAPLAAGGLAATLVGRGVPATVAGRGAHVLPAAIASTAVFALTFATVEPLAVVPSIVALALGILGAAYAVGRWTDIHVAADRPPSLVLYGSLAAGFVLVYWRPPL